MAIAHADQTISDVQQALKEQGFYYGEVTGEKNSDTAAAIRRYQIRNGLEITGDLNDATLQAIKSTRSAANSSSIAPAPPVTQPQPVAPNSSDLRDDSVRDGTVNSPPLRPFATEPARPADPGGGQIVPSRGGLFAGTPYEGAPIEVQRKVIVDAQKTLARRDLFKNEIDGAYGPALEFSLRAYQSRVGLPMTGRLDLETLAALQLLPGAHSPVFTRRPGLPPEPPVRGEWIRP